jgi:hypothetical protein
LVNLIALGSAWFSEIASGRAATLSALAEREGVTPAYVAQLVELSFLSPSLKQAILRGEQPAELTATRLKAMCPLPLAWVRQAEVLAA